MYPTGHYGIALLVAAPSAFVLGRRAGTVFSTVVVFAALLPDLDRHLPYVTHHGATHTFLFAVVAGLAVGLLAAGAVVGYVRFVGEPRSRKLTGRNVFVWAAVGAFFGTSAHVVADVLVLLPGTQPVSLFWPVFERKLHVETVPLGATARNLGLLVAGLAAQAMAFRYGWRR
jgi:membrane-bound metal-dependent hydrolase YbcI (DUF457 family)